MPASAPSYSINLSASLSGASVSVTAGLLLVPDVNGNYVVATAANRGTMRADGIALGSGAPFGAVAIQSVGKVPASITGLGVGAASWGRTSTTGTLERIASPGATDDVCAWVEADGSAHMMCGVGAGVAGGSSSVPTGTGIPHIVGGVQNAAASLIVDADVSASAAIAASKVVQATGTGIPHVIAGALVAASSLIINADVDPTAAINCTKTDGVFGAVSVSTTGTLTVGASASTTGTIRLPQTGSIKINDGGTDRNAVIGAAASVTFGDANYTNTFMRGTNLQLVCTGSMFTQCPTIFFTDTGGSSAITAALASAGATSLTWTVGTTPTITQASTSVGSATGKKFTITAQTATGVTSTGGDLEVGPGTGTTANGSLSLINIISTTTVGAAGAANALPANPQEYLNVKINGNARRIPAYL